METCSSNAELGKRRWSLVKVADSFWASCLPDSSCLRCIRQLSRGNDGEAFFFSNPNMAFQVYSF